MKRILTLGIVLLTVNSLLPAQEITFSETKFNWGTVREQDGNVSHDFRFVNTGDKPLTIKNIITGCGCTSSEWTEKAYQPGEEGGSRFIFPAISRVTTPLAALLVYISATRLMSFSVLPCGW